MGDIEGRVRTGVWLLGKDQREDGYNALAYDPGDQAKTHHVTEPAQKPRTRTPSFSNIPGSTPLDNSLALGLLELLLPQPHQLYVPLNRIEVHPPNGLTVPVQILDQPGTENLIQKAGGSEKNCAYVEDLPAKRETDVDGERRPENLEALVLAEHV